MLVNQTPIQCRALRAVRSLQRFALCSVFIFGTTTVYANELSYNQFSADVGVSGDFVSNDWNTKDVNDQSISVEVGKKTYIELTHASGVESVVAASVGWFENSSPSDSVYAQFGALFDTGGSGDIGLAAAFGIRKLLSPYIELSPSFSMYSLINHKKFTSPYIVDESVTSAAAISLAIRFYPAKYISIDLQGVSSKEASGTMLGISGHF